MLNNRFQEITQKPDAPFLYAGSGYGAFIGRTIDVYSLSAAAKENQIEKSLELLLSENERVRQFGFTSTELDREKKDVLTMYDNIAREADKTVSATFADEFVRNYLTRECIPGYQKENEIVKEFLPSITLDEVNKMGQSLTSDDNLLVLLTAQEKEGVKVPTEQEVVDIIKSVRSKKVEAYVDSVTDVPLMPEEPVATKVIRRIDDSNFGFTELTFANGVRMILKPTDFKNDEILVSAFSPGGLPFIPITISCRLLASTIVTQSGLGSYDYTGLQKKLQATPQD
jgi:zinc protease